MSHQVNLINIIENIPIGEECQVDVVLMDSNNFAEFICDHDSLTPGCAKVTGCHQECL